MGGVEGEGVGGGGGAGAGGVVDACGASSSSVSRGSAGGPRTVAVTGHWANLMQQRAVTAHARDRYFREVRSKL